MPELTCQRCSEKYSPWFVANELWNKTVKDNESYFCMDCFAFIAEERKTVPDTVIWRLEATNIK